MIIRDLFYSKERACVFFTLFYSQFRSYSCKNGIKMVGQIVLLTYHRLVFEIVSQSVVFMCLRCAVLVIITDKVIDG